MGLVLLLLIGLIAGLIASHIMNRAYPWYIDVVLAIVGAWVGGFLLSLFDLGGGYCSAYTSCAGEGLIWELIAGVIGACVIIAIVHAVRREPIR